MSFLSNTIGLMNDYLPNSLMYFINKAAGASVLFVRIRERPRDFDLHVFYTRWAKQSAISLSCLADDELDGPSHHITQSIYTLGATFEARGIHAFWTFDDSQEGWSVMDDFHHLYGGKKFDA
jgi:hypothetical protein